MLKSAKTDTWRTFIFLLLFFSLSLPTTGNGKVADGSVCLGSCVLFLLLDWEVKSFWPVVGFPMLYNVFVDVIWVQFYKREEL